MNNPLTPEQRALGALQIVDRLVAIAEERGVIIDGYVWEPDPADERRGSDYYFLTVSSNRRHAQAKFSRAYLEERPAAEGADIRAVLRELVTVLAGRSA